MALFSRRNLQGLINTTSSFLSERQTREFVHRLNKVRSDYIATEWELALIDTFSKLGNVQYEPGLGGNRTADLLFKSSDANFTFAAEIATISDQPLHQANPVRGLLERLAEKTLAAQIITGGFHVQVGSTYPVRGLFQRGVRIGLNLPTKERFDELIFNDGFQAFVDRVKNSPETANDYAVLDRANRIDVRISYRPAFRGVAANFGSYTFATRIDRNPLYNALKSKADQLKKTLFSGLKGIVICDGGCQLLRRVTLTWCAYSTQEIVQEFFRKHTSVVFVLIITVRGTTSVTALHDRRIVPDVALYIRPDAQQLKHPLTRYIGNLAAHLPRIEGSPENVLNHMRFRKRGSFHGGYMLTDTSVRISATSLLQLLAGELSYKEFSSSHQFSGFNPFRKHLNLGEMLSAAEIIHTKEEDDDWIEFRFGPPDSAIAPFRLPAKINENAGALNENAEEERSRIHNYEK